MYCERKANDLENEGEGERENWERHWLQFLSISQNCGIIKVLEAPLTLQKNSDSKIQIEKVYISLNFMTQYQSCTNAELSAEFA